MQYSLWPASLRDNGKLDKVPLGPRRDGADLLCDRGGWVFSSARLVNENANHYLHPVCPSSGTHVGRGVIAVSRVAAEARESRLPNPGDIGQNLTSALAPASVAVGECRSWPTGRP